MSEAIGRPADRYGGRRPHIAVVRRVLPLPIVVQIGVSGRVRGNVLLRLRALGLAIAGQRPVIELIGRAQRAHDRRQLLRAGERSLLLRVDRITGAICRRLRVALGDLDDRRVARFVHFHPVLPWLLERDREVRRVHLEVVALIHRAHPHDDGSRRYLHLRGVIIEIQERKAGRAAQADRRRSDIQLRARILVRPEFVAGGQRAIDIRRSPILYAGRLQGDRPLGLADPRDASGWILVLPRLAGVLCERGTYCERDQQQNR